MDLQRKRRYINKILGQPRITDVVGTHSPPEREVWRKTSGHFQLRIEQTNLNLDAWGMLGSNCCACDFFCLFWSLRVFWRPGWRLPASARPLLRQSLHHNLEVISYMHAFNFPCLSNLGLPLSNKPWKAQARKGGPRVPPLLKTV